MKLEIQVWFRNPILRKKAEEFVDFKDAEKIEKDMVDFLNSEDNWVWIAGPQLWISKRIFIAQFDKKTSTTVINPKILEFSEKTSVLQEWCLSLFWVWADVERPREIIVEFFTAEWKKRKRKLKWFASKVFQHELDHLDWILFIDRATWKNVSLDKEIDLKKLQLDDIIVDTKSL